MTPIITNGTLTRYRQAEGAYDRGVWVPGAETSATSLASAQPEQGQFTKDAGYGDRSADYIKVYVSASFDLRGEDQYGTKGADEIEHTAFPGNRYRVVRVKSHQFSPILAHTHAVCARIDEGSEEAKNG
jgi:hypothetical protein